MQLGSFIGNNIRVYNIYNKVYTKGNERLIDKPGGVPLWELQN